MFKSTLKLLGIVILLLVSFIYTDKVTRAAKDNDSLMSEVINYKKKNDVKPVEPIINGDEAILGYSGVSIDKEKSYKQMKKINKFLKEQIVYNTKMPNNTISDMCNYYIMGGNPSNKSISIVFYVRSDTNLKKMLKKLDDINIKAAFFVDGSWLENNIDKAFAITNSKHELYNLGYNGVYDKKHINKINKLIENISLEKSNYCIKNVKNNTEKKVCASRNMNYIIPTLYNPNITDFKQKLDKGIIISYDLEQVDIKNINLIINSALSKGYSIKPLKEVLNEKKD